MPKEIKPKSAEKQKNNRKKMWKMIKISVNKICFFICNFFSSHIFVAFSFDCLYSKRIKKKR